MQLIWYTVSIDAYIVDRSKRITIQNYKLLIPATFSNIECQQNESRPLIQFVTILR